MMTVLGEGFLLCGAGLSWVAGQGVSWTCELAEERPEEQVQQQQTSAKGTSL